MDDDTKAQCFEFLNNLKEQNFNMHGAKPFLMKGFPAITESEAHAVIQDWVNSVGYVFPT